MGLSGHGDERGGDSGGYGISTQPSDSLLAERARDYLAGGAADSATLISHICALPGVPRPVADRMADELLRGRREFARTDDGRWMLASQAAAAAVREPTARVPSFDEWRAAREAARAQATPADVVERERAADRSAGRAERRPRVTERRATEPPPPEPGADDPLVSLSYAVVDVETTGGSPFSGHRITELAAVVVRDGEVREVYETLVNPDRPIPPQIMKLTGITHEMVRDQPRFREVSERVIGALAGQVFVAHNVNFDWRFVSAEVERASGVRLDGRRLCTVRLARKILPHLRSRSLGWVADYYGADAFARTYFEGRHRGARPWRHSAAGDAVATAHCMLRMFEEAAARGVHTWGELNALIGAATPTARRRRPSSLPGAVTRDTTA